MIAAPTACLMYHELELPNRSLCQSEAGYVRYIVSRDDFRDQMFALRDAKLQGISVSQMLDGASGVALSFDDGCETDLIAAAPLLQELNFCATFYITTGFLGKRGYLKHDQVRELAAYPVDIGCHSITHPYLTDLDEAGLQREIADAKESLEQVCGKRVEHFSCPGGRWDTRVADVARKAGYRSVATSRSGLNSKSTNCYSLARIAVMRGTTLPHFRELANGRGLWPIQLRENLRSTIRTLLGNSAYDKARSVLLKKS